MVQRNERALALGIRTTKIRGIGASDELSPISMDNLRPSLNQRIRDVLQKRGIWIEVRYGKGFEFATFTTKVLLHKVNDLTVGSIIRNIPEGG